MTVEKVRLLCIGMVIISVASRALFLNIQMDSLAIYMLTPRRLDGLATGGLIAIAWNEDNELKYLRKVAPLMIAIPVFVLAPVTIRSRALYIFDVPIQLFEYTAMSIFFGGVLVWVITSRSDARIVRALGWTPVKTVGQCSYGIYLFHYPLTILFGGRFLDPASVTHAWSSHVWGFVVFFVLLSAFCTLLGWLSWNGFEKQLLKLKPRLASPDVAGVRIELA